MMHLFKLSKQYTLRIFYFHFQAVFRTMTISEIMVCVEVLIVSMFTVYCKSEGTGAKCYAFDCTSFEMYA
jgi:hypothetical protein